MNLKLLAASLFAICCVTAPAVAQKSPLKNGDYVCRNKGQITGSFSVTGPTTYVDSDGRKRSLQYDKGLNVLNFDDGKQYFVGREDLLVLVVNGQMSKHGCIRQSR
ncbi:hypothetical protein [Devosia epidermidihirudinis]|nr:hypothetical protein [Devosia epidermidihirudinis]